MLTPDGLSPLSTERGVVGGEKLIPRGDPSGEVSKGGVKHSLTRIEGHGECLNPPTNVEIDGHGRRLDGGPPVTTSTVNFKDVRGLYPRRV